MNLLSCFDVFSFLFLLVSTFWKNMFFILMLKDGSSLNAWFCLVSFWRDVVFELSESAQSFAGAMMSVKIRVKNNLLYIFFLIFSFVKKFFPKVINKPDSVPELAVIFCGTLCPPWLIALLRCLIRLESGLSSSGDIPTSGCLDHLRSKKISKTPKNP